MEFRNRVMITLYVRQQKRHRCIEQSFGEGEGGRYGESNMETYITICKVDSQWEFAV